MKAILFLFISFIFLGNSYSSNRDSLPPEIEFFNSMEGFWEGMPEDTSFVSVLDYNRGNHEHFVFVNNDLFSKKRKLLSHYEGVYFFNPNSSRIEYTTINNSEIHRGYCKMNGDTLFHFATIKTRTGNTRAYSSAIVKVNDKTLAYYAVYGKDEKIPELVFENPLVYRKTDEQKRK